MFPTVGGAGSSYSCLLAPRGDLAVANSWTVGRGPGVSV